MKTKLSKIPTPIESSTFYEKTITLRDPSKDLETEVSPREATFIPFQFFLDQNASTQLLPSVNTRIVGKDGTVHLEVETPILFQHIGSPSRKFLSPDRRMFIRPVIEDLHQAVRWWCALPPCLFPATSAELRYQFYDLLEHTATSSKRIKDITFVLYEIAVIKSLSGNLACKDKRFSWSLSGDAVQKEGWGKSAKGLANVPALSGSHSASSHLKFDRGVNPSGSWQDLVITHEMVITINFAVPVNVSSASPKASSVTVPVYVAGVPRKKFMETSWGLLVSECERIPVVPPQWQRETERALQAIGRPPVPVSAPQEGQDPYQPQYIDQNLVRTILQQYTNDQRLPETVDELQRRQTRLNSSPSTTSIPTNFTPPSMNQSAQIQQPQVGSINLPPPPLMPPPQLPNDQEPAMQSFPPSNPPAPRRMLQPISLPSSNFGISNSQQMQSPNFSLSNDVIQPNRSPSVHLPNNNSSPSQSANFAIPSGYHQHSLESPRVPLSGSSSSSSMQQRQSPIVSQESNFHPPGYSTTPRDVNSPSFSIPQSSSFQSPQTQTANATIREMHSPNFSSPSSSHAQSPNFSIPNTITQPVQSPNLSMYSNFQQNENQSPLPSSSSTVTQQQHPLYPSNDDLFWYNLLESSHREPHSNALVSLSSELTKQNLLRSKSLGSSSAGNSSSSHPLITPPLNETGHQTPPSSGSGLGGDQKTHNQEIILEQIKHEREFEAKLKSASGPLTPESPSTPVTSATIISASALVSDFVSPITVPKRTVTLDPELLRANEELINSNNRSVEAWRSMMGVGENVVFEQRQLGMSEEELVAIALKESLQTNPIDRSGDGVVGLATFSGANDEEWEQFHEGGDMEVVIARNESIQEQNNLGLTEEELVDLAIKASLEETNQAGSSSSSSSIRAVDVAQNNASSSSSSIYAGQQEASGSGIRFVSSPDEKTFELMKIAGNSSQEMLPPLNLDSSFDINLTSDDNTEDLELDYKIESEIEVTLPRVKQIVKRPTKLE
ncbi:hypothetical protein HK098_003060 [Nowakowskiella sp. JEL0407]|nr:hypothetical protein HK098_003060 [Nowakowskiella sp. JEL0407]